MTTPYPPHDPNGPPVFVRALGRSKEALPPEYWDALLADNPRPSDMIDPTLPRAPETVADPAPERKPGVMLRPLSYWWSR